MEEFEATPKKWGNSLGVTIPKNIVKKEKLTTTKKVRVIILPVVDLREIFGTLKMNQPLQEIMDEIDKGND